jgi:hypothetical protein
VAVVECMTCGAVVDDAWSVCPACGAVPGLDPGEPDAATFPEAGRVAAGETTRPVAGDPVAEWPSASLEADGELAERAGATHRVVQAALTLLAWLVFLVAIAWIVLDIAVIVDGALHGAADQLLGGVILLIPGLVVALAALAFRPAATRKRSARNRSPDHRPDRPPGSSAY